MATTLGTLQGTLQAGADQQNSQADELARLEGLEAENAAATGVLQVLEVSNEVALFEGEQEMKLRNAAAKVRTTSTAMKADVTTLRPGKHRGRTEATDSNGY